MLKTKINKATYDALADVLKAEYKANGDNFVLDTDEATDLITARDKEKRDGDAAKLELKNTKAELETLRAANGDFTALENSYKAKITGLETQLGEANTTLTATRRDMHAGAAAEGIAKRFTVPSLVKGQILARLDVDPKDGKTVRVLDAAGKPSAATLVDLEKEFVDNPDFKSIVIASKASGSAATGQQRASGASNPLTDNNGQPKLLAAMSPAELVAHRQAAKEATQP